MDKPKLVIIGSSGASLPILNAIFKDMPKLGGPVILIQHMPIYINQSVCENLAAKTDLAVKIAQHNESVQSAILYIAPSEVHLKLLHNERIWLGGGEKVNFVCPSIDVAMTSLTKMPPVVPMGILLSGVGDDGIRGISHIKKLGGVTVALDRRASTITSMAEDAVATGDVDWVLNTEQIRNKIIDHLGQIRP